MMQSLREMMHSLRISPIFAFFVLVTLGWAGVIGLMVFLMQLQPGFMGMAHGIEPAHRTHDLTYGLLFATAVVGILAQLRRPSKNVAGMLMALFPWVGLLLAAVLSTDASVLLSLERMSVALLTVIVALLHPTGHAFFRSFSVSRVNRVMLALVIIAAVPLLVFASSNIGLQRTVPDDHAALGHYGFMAAFGFTIIGVGLLASLRPDGWRLTAWVAGLLPAFLGLTSVVFPDASSSLGLVWALAAIAWGVVFIAAAELTKGILSKADTGVRPDRSSTSGTPRWVKVLGIIAIVLVLLGGIIVFTGVDGEHGPSRQTPSGDTDGQTPPSRVIEDHTPPGADLAGHALPKGRHG
jgi:hypothetical protein